MRRVFDVTLRRLAEVGYEALSVPEIARLAGLNKTSVYRRWPTKADLVRAALEASTANAQLAPDTGSLAGDLLALGEAVAGFVSSPQGLGVLRTLASGPGEAHELAASMYRAAELQAPRTIARRAVKRRELAPGADLELALFTLAGAMLHRVLVERAPITPPWLERLVDLVLHGVLRKHS